jgi:hypothetical protein
LVTSNTCQRDTEGAAEPALYGGTNADDNSGRMSFVQIRYSGFALAPDKELQALTTGGVGSATVFNNIQSHNSSDDGAEFFGGVVNMKYFVATGADDDSLDVDMGAQMNLQYALLLPRSGKGDALFEIDSDGKESDTPRTKLHVSNFLAIQPQTSPDNEGSKGALAAAYFRGNSDTTLTNGILLAPNNECIRMKSTSSSGSAPASLTTRSVVLQCNTTKYLGVTFTAAQVSGFFGSGSNNNNDAFTPTLATLFVNGSNETAVPAFDASTLSSYFTKTTYIGAVQNGADTWYAGWTCNSGTANFGSTSTACTSLPTT